jgi:hypothetical protein
VLASCKRLATLKKLGGWGLKNIYLFSKDLVAKSVRGGLIEGLGLWPQSIKEKYFPCDTIIHCIHNPNKKVKMVQSSGKPFLMLPP